MAWFQSTCLPTVFVVGSVPQLWIHSVESLALGGDGELEAVAVSSARRPCNIRDDVPGLKQELGLVEDANELRVLASTHVGEARVGQRCRSSQVPHLAGTALCLLLLVLRAVSPANIRTLPSLVSKQ